MPFGSRPHPREMAKSREKNSLKCPRCDKPSLVMDKRTNWETNETLRYRMCKNGHRFKTIERFEPKGWSR